MSVKCEFCEGTGKEPDLDGCVWCHSTGMKVGQTLAAPASPQAAQPVHTCQHCWGAGAVLTRLPGEGETDYRNRRNASPLPNRNADAGDGVNWKAVATEQKGIIERKQEGLVAHWKVVCDQRAKLQLAKKLLRQSLAALNSRAELATNIRSFIGSADTEPVEVVARGEGVLTFMRSEGERSDACACCDGAHVFCRYLKGLPDFLDLTQAARSRNDLEGRTFRVTVEVLPSSPEPEVKP